MVVVPLTQPEKEAKMQRCIDGVDATNWARIAAGASLMAGGLLLLTGRRKAGLVTAAGGTALALLDQQETVKAWWDALPGYIDRVQGMLGKVEDTVAELEQQRARLDDVLNR